MEWPDPPACLMHSVERDLYEGFKDVVVQYRDGTHARCDEFILIKV